MGRLRFSANLGFLWADRPLPEAIRAAHAAGFDAVECHWPYEVPPEAVRAALEETGLPMLGLNSSRGNPAVGEIGLSALPGREAEARETIDQALDYAQAIGAKNIHVVAGNAQGAAAEAAFVENLSYAAAQAAERDLTILIEPLNAYDAPSYFLRTTEQAIHIMDQVGSPAIKLMFDCYHVQLTEGDVSNRLTRLLPRIGHIQFAGAPGRGTPDTGELNYTHIFETIAALDWPQPLGAEYRPSADTESSLGWLQAARQV